MSGAHLHVKGVTGTNTFEINEPNAGIYLVQVKGKSFSSTEKLLF